MKQLKLPYSLVLILTAVSLFTVFLIALLTLQAHVIFYQEQHALFLFDAAYIKQTIHDQGIIYCLGAFIIQFYHIPWLGASIVAAMLTAIYLMTESIIRRLTGLRDLLQLGAAAAVGLYFTLHGVDQNPGIVTAVFLALLVAQASSLRISALRKSSLRPLQFALPIVLAAAYIMGGYWWELRNYDRNERAMIRAERAVKQGDWDLAINITENYINLGRNNTLMHYLRNYALAQKGELLKRLFDVPQESGIEGLFFPWRGNSRAAEYGHLAHELAGNINDAHHWAFEAMTVWGETAPHLIDLARYNIAMGRPRVAQKFVNRLSHSLFYRSEAKEFQQQIDDMERGISTTETSRPTRFINVIYPARDLMEIVKAEPDNKPARDYLLALLLLANDQEALIGQLRPGEKNPEVVEQAMLIYSLYPRVTPLSDLGLEFSEATSEKFAQYHSMMRSGSDRLKEQLGNTFWYYIYNYCPYGANKRNTIGSQNDSPGSQLYH